MALPEKITKGYFPYPEEIRGKSSQREFTTKRYRILPLPLWGTTPEKIRGKSSNTERIPPYTLKKLSPIPRIGKDTGTVSLLVKILYPESREKGCKNPFR